MPVTEYIWDDVNDCVLEEIDELGATQVTYTHEPAAFGPLVSEYRDGTTYNHHYDALGSTTMLTDDAGDVTDTFTFDAWGNQVARTGTTETPYTWVGRWGYQDDSATTGMYYIRAGSYQPMVARWMSVDLLWLTFLVNQYSYSNNAPSHLFDYDGRACHERPMEYGMSLVAENLEILPLQRQVDLASIGQMAKLW